MNLLSKFKKAEIESTEPVEQKSELPVIQVKDIKGHLVNMFEENRLKEDRIEELEQTIEDLKQTELEYKAALVTLDEYSNRLKRKDQRIEKLEKNTAEKNNVIDDLNDKINSYKILEYEHDNLREKVQKDVKNGTLQAVIHLVKATRGNLSKQRLVDDIKRLMEVPND